jgi:transposase
VIMREVVNGLMYILSTGCQWRAIPKDLPPKSSVYDYFDLWTWFVTLSQSQRRPDRQSALSRFDRMAPRDRICRLLEHHGAIPKHAVARDAAALYR